MVFLMKAGNGCPRAVQKVARTLQVLLTISTPQIVVAQDDNRSLHEVWPEHALTACVETVAVDQGKDGIRLCHDRERCI